MHHKLTFQRHQDQALSAIQSPPPKCRNLIFVLKPTREEHVTGGPYELLIYKTHDMTSRRDCKIKWNPTLVVGTASKGDDKIIKVAYHFSVPDGYVAEYDEEWKVARSLSDKLESVHLVNSKNTNQLFALCTAYAPSKQHDLHPTPFCILPKLDDKGMFFKNRLKLEAYYETKGTSIIQEGMKFNDVRRRLRPVYCFDSGSERHWTFKLSEIQRPQSLTYVFRTEKSGAVTICSKERDSELGEEDILAEGSQVYQAWEHESMYEAVQPHYPQYQPRGRTTHPKPLPNMRHITSVLPSLPLTHLQNFDSVDIPYSPSTQRKIKRYRSLTPSSGTPSPSFPSPRVRQHRAMSWNPSAPPTDAETDWSPWRPLNPASSPASTATLTAFDGDPSPKPFQSSPELSSMQIDASGRSGANRGVKKKTVRSKLERNIRNAAKNSIRNSRHGSHLLRIHNKKTKSRPKVPIDGPESKTTDTTITNGNRDQERIAATPATAFLFVWSLIHGCTFLLGLFMFFERFVLNRGEAVVNAKTIDGNIVNQKD